MRAGLPGPRSPPPPAGRARGSSIAVQARPGVSPLARCRRAAYAGRSIPGRERGMTTDPAALGAVELLQLYRRKALSPVEAVQAVLARIERFGPAVNAFCLVDAERALAAARASEARWQRGA